MIRQLGQFLSTALGGGGGVDRLGTTRRPQQAASVCRFFVWLSLTFEGANHHYIVELIPTSAEIMPRSKFDLSPVTEGTAIRSNAGLSQTIEELTHPTSIGLGHLRKDIITLSNVSLGVTHQSVSGSAHHTCTWCSGLLEKVEKQFNSEKT
jgi:hypothetical protein